MKKFWKKASAKAGFTLVELVVVIAVLAILAAVAYPAYTGYIERANDAKVISQVSNVLTAVKSAEAVAGVTNDISKITITKSSNIITMKVEFGSSPSISNEQKTKINSAVVDFLGSDAATKGSEDFTWTLKNIDFSGTSYIADGYNGIEWSKDAESGTTEWRANKTGG